MVYDVICGSDLKRAVSICSTEFALSLLNEFEN